MLKNYLKVIQDAKERNKTIILPDENVIPSNIGINTNKVKHLNLEKGNVIKYKKVYAKAEPLKICDGKYKFDFKAPHKTSDRGAYYEMEYKNSVPKGYIRIAFCLKPSDSIADCNTYGVSRDTWEANNSKYVTIFSFKVKEGQEETQQSIMEEIGNYIVKRLYKKAIITIININNETKEGTSDEQ